MEPTGSEKIDDENRAEFECGTLKNVNFLEDFIHAEPSGSLNVPPILLQQMLLCCYAFLYSFISHWFKKALKYVAETRHMKRKK